MPTTLEEKIAQAEYIRETYLPIPHMYIRDIMGANTWFRQDEIVQSVFRYKLTAVKTCNAVGKSYIAARTAIAYLMLYPGSIVVTTAPTWRQVTDVLWREIGTAVKRSKYKLTNVEATQAGLNLDTDWYAVGLSTKRPENFFGYHADHILVIVDEAGGVEEPIFKGVAAITPNANARILYIGNPTTPSGTFYDVFTKPELGANCITISAFDTPNFIDTGIRTVEDLLELYTPKGDTPQADWSAMVDAELQKRMNSRFAGLIAPSVVYGRYHEWGPDSSAWESLIMGEFPTQANQALFPTNLVTQAMNMYGIDEATGKTYAELSGWNIPYGPPTYGQDMARYGNDTNVLTPRQGGWYERQIVWRKTSLMESAKRILSIIDPLDENTTVNIDDTGNGGGTTDRMREKGDEAMASGKPAHQYRLNAYNFSSKEFMNDEDRDKYHDITSMLYWNLRQQFMNKAIALHYDKELFDQLVGRRWKINASGKIQVESKEEYVKRTGGKSPDKSDSLALAAAAQVHGNWSAPEEASIRERPQERGPVLAGASGVTAVTPYEEDLTPITSRLDQRY